MLNSWVVEVSAVTKVCAKGLENTNPDIPDSSVEPTFAAIDLKEESPRRGHRLQASGDSSNVLSSVFESFAAPSLTSFERPLIRQPRISI